MEYPLDDTLLELESQLSALVPCAPSSTFTERVDAEVNHSLIDASIDVHDAELKDLEAHLGLLAPAGMSGDVLTRMTEAMDRWHEHVPVEEKIVPIGENVAQELKEQASSSKPANVSMFSAAAAVALLGAAAALVMPHFNNSSSMATSGSGAASNSQGAPAIFSGASSNAVDVSNVPSDTWVVPDSLSHNVTQTSDAGILMTRDNVPHRSIRIDYIDRIKVLDEDGREIEINRPGVQYMLIPVQTN